MSKTIHRLPSLNALKAFWAAARHGSFVGAADELHVTASAVSLQVRQLEQELGQKLFERTPRGLALTGYAGSILPGISNDFQLLQDTLITSKETDALSTLSVSVAPSFATKWLMPRLDRFCSQHPDIDVRVVATPDLADFGGTGPQRFWLFTLKALAFIAVRSGRPDEAQALLDQITRLDPQASVGGEVIARLVAAAQAPAR